MSGRSLFFASLCGVLSCSLALYPAASHADALQRQQQEKNLAEVRASIQQLQKKIRARQGKKSAAEKKLREVETRLGRLQATIRQRQQQITANRHRLSALQQQHGLLQARLAKQRQLLEQQLYSAYVNGQREQIKLLLNQEDPAALGRLSTYFDYINRARTEQIEATRTALVERQALERRIATENQALLSLQQQQESQRQALSNNRARRQQVLRDIRAQLQRQGRKLTQLRSNEQEIEMLISSLAELINDIPDRAVAQTDFASLRGKLQWPTQGRLSNQFGRRRAVGDLLWHGIMLDAPAGREVKAVAGGHVVYADWLQGFGLLIIIDHNDGYLSLYGHNRVLFKEAGDWVSPHEAIAQVGDSGGLEQAALYFELRHRGKPIDPERWCVKL